MSSSSKVICQATASLKKELGVLTLTKRKLTWASSKNTAGEPEVTILSSNINGLFASKPGAGEPKLRVVVELGGPQTFGFPNPQDAQVFKDQLSAVSKRNLEKSQAPTPIGNGTPPSGSAGAGPASSTPAGSRVPSGLSVPQVASAAVSVPGSRSSSVAPGRFQNKNDLKRKVLLRSPELANLHKELVISGQITESEFWESREVCFGHGLPDASLIIQN
ncbi:RNA polymerase II transcription factor B subunit 1 [Tulasnella sp. 419]|nr:RNA polymerase II transcription factor B subunit 1 [Tulasnella sp. 419]